MVDIIKDKDKDVIPYKILRLFKEGGVVFNFLRKHKMVTTIHDVSKEAVLDSIKYVAFTTGYSTKELANPSLTEKIIDFRFHKYTCELCWDIMGYSQHSFNKQTYHYYLPRKEYMDSYGSMKEKGERIVHFDMDEDGFVTEKRKDD